jgi:hypothetical protein
MFPSGRLQLALQQVLQTVQALGGTEQRFQRFGFAQECRRRAG